MTREIHTFLNLQHLHTESCYTSLTEISPLYLFLLILKHWMKRTERSRDLFSECVHFVMTEVWISSCYFLTIVLASWFAQWTVNTVNVLCFMLNKSFEVFPYPCASCVHFFLSFSSWYTCHTVLSGSERLHKERGLRENPGRLGIHPCSMFHSRVGVTRVWAFTDLLQMK